MKYGIAIFPSKDLQDLTNSYRKRYDPHYALIPPHITIKNAFEADSEKIKLISDKLEVLSNQYEPFHLHIQKVSSFQPVNNVIYLKVEPHDTLTGLHNELHTDFVGIEPEFSFVPHITIAQKLSDEEHSDVFGSLRMVDFDFEEYIDRFHLLYQLDNGQWTVYETFRLGEG